MSVRGRFLGGGDVAVVPGKEETEGMIDDGSEDGWVENRLPGRDRGKDRFSAKEKVYGCRTGNSVPQ